MTRDGDTDSKQYANTIKYPAVKPLQWRDKRRNYFNNILGKLLNMFLFKIIFNTLWTEQYYKKRGIIMVPIRV